MISRILTCDGCHATAGARPASSGSEARKLSHAGSIRRVRLGTVHYPAGRYAPERRQPRSADLCGACRSDGTPAAMGARVAASVAAYGATWEPRA